MQRFQIYVDCGLDPFLLFAELARYMRQRGVSAELDASDEMSVDGDRVVVLLEWDECVWVDPKLNEVRRFDFLWIVEARNESSGVVELVVGIALEFLRAKRLRFVDVPESELGG